MFILTRMRSFLLPLLLLDLVFPAFAQSPYRNVQISSGKQGPFAPCEPSIAISASNPSHMIAGAVLDYVYSSSDSGKTWQQERLRSRYGVYGDPCVIADNKGRFYYFHLSNPSGEGWSNPDILDRIVCQKRSRWFHRWSRGTGIGFHHPKDQDKEWAAFDPASGTLVLTWTEFDTYGNTDPACKSRILYASSRDRGKHWTAPVPLHAPEGNCLDESGTAEGAVPAIGTDGQVYTAWSLDGKLYFSSFSQRGETTMSEARVITSNAEWAFDISGIGRANGMPVTKCDRSEGLHHGTIYVNWADQRNGADDTDIWLSKSTDGGQTWTVPTRVNDDPPGKQQFFTWMDVDQKTGYIYIVFYDRRHHSDEQTDVYLAVSRDGGDTFENIRISESPFRPSPGIFFGDYNNISAVNGVIRPIWTRSDNGQLSIWTALINE